MVGRIAPYLASNVQQSYLRQQRVGERIADAKSRENPDKPLYEVEISDAARKAANEAKATASIHKQQHIEELTDRFVEQYLEKPAEALPPAAAQALAAAQEGAENADEVGEAGEKQDTDKTPVTDETPNKGRAAFVSLIESFGLEVAQDDNGEDRAIVNKDSGEEVVPLTNSTREAVKNELSQLVKNILGEVL